MKNWELRRFTMNSDPLRLTIELWKLRIDPWNLTMEPKRLILELWRVCTL